MATPPPGWWRLTTLDRDVHDELVTIGQGRSTRERACSVAQVQQPAKNSGDPVPLVRGFAPGTEVRPQHAEAPDSPGSAWNDRCTPFTWTKDPDTVIAKATNPRKRKTPVTSVTEH